MLGSLVAAAPIAAGALTYLTARSSLAYDLFILGLLRSTRNEILRRENEDSFNLFNDLEHFAHEPSTGSKAFIWFQGKSHTYEQVYNIVLRYGTWMRQQYNVGKNQVVAINFESSLEFIYVWFGLWSIGAKPAFINHNVAGSPLAHCIRTSTAKLCLYDPRQSDNIKGIKNDLEDVQLVELSEQVKQEIMRIKPVRLPDEARKGERSRDMAILIYTSGTTGLPKPAVVSWRKAVGAALGPNWMSEISRDDIIYSAMPLYHGLGSLMGVCAAVLNGHTLAQAHKFSNATFWSEVRASKATRILYIGEAIRFVASAPPQYDPTTGECVDKKHHVKRIVGSGLRPDVWPRFRDRFGIEQFAELYSATEGVTTLWNKGDNNFSVGAVGRAGWLLSAVLNHTAPLVQVDWETEQPWRDPETGHCKVVDKGATGEMLLRLDANDIAATYQGYYNNDQASSSKVLRDVFRKGDAWFRTGDTLRWGDDGLLYFSDRIGDTFRWKGENVSTAEISHILGLHEAVHEANVYGVALPNHDGRAGCAAITFAAGPPSRATLKSLADHVVASLPRYAVPLFIRVVDEEAAREQKTGTNKQQKHLLRKEGVKPSNGDSQLFWLREGAYVPFGEESWTDICRGQVKL